MDEYEFLETEGGMEGRGRSREVTPLRKQQPGQQQQNRSSPQQPSCRSPQQESPLRRALEQPPLKRFKVDKYQDAGTSTDPESLGACEPGTAISLEGIVWNETKGGLLSLNLTWRGKSFVGTLLDCSTTDHGSVWTSPWHSDTLAPDQRPRKPRLAKKSKRRKKKGKNDKKEAVKDDDDENIDVDDEGDDDEEEEASVKASLPAERAMVQCTEVEGCGKKFFSESALQYHISFAHNKIEVVKPTPAPANASDNAKEETPDKKVEANNAVIRESEEDKKPAMNGTLSKEDPVLAAHKLAPPPSPTSANKVSPPDVEKKKHHQQKPFPSTLKIRPIVPAQPIAIPGLPGLALKPIQPKPTILPDPSPSLCLDDLRKVSKKKSPKQDGAANKSPSRGALENGGPKTKYQFEPKPLVPSPVTPKTERPEPVVIDLSQPSKPPTPGAPHMAPQGPHMVPQGPRPGSQEYYRMLEAYGFPPYPHPVPPGLEPARHMQLLATDPGYRNQFEQSRADKAREFKAQIDRDNKEKDMKTGIPVRGTPSPSMPPKAHSPQISIRSEFKTGHLRDIKDHRDPNRGSPHGLSPHGSPSPYSRPGDQELMAKLAMGSKGSPSGMRVGSPVGPGGIRDQELLAKLAMHSPGGPGGMRDQELMAKLARQAPGHPMLSSLFSAPPGMAPQGMAPPGWPPGMMPPGLMMPPASPHHTPSYAMPPASPHHAPSYSMGMPPASPHHTPSYSMGMPPTSMPTSFGSSLAALSRTAQSFVSTRQDNEERARKTNATPPTRSPTTSNTSNTSSNPGGVGDGISPLLRHEHTHTHLHLGFNLSSPTHNS